MYLFPRFEGHENLKGKNVLILGAGTSVGSNGVQFAKHYFGAKNVVATCSANSAEKVESLGADVIIDYTKGETAKTNEILEFVKVNGKFDFVLDTVRDSSIYPISTAVLHGANKGGVFAKVAGSTTLDYNRIKIADLLPSYASLKYSIVGKWNKEHAKHVVLMLHDNKDYGDAVDKLNKEGHFQFIIDSEYDGLTEYKAAIEKVALSKAKGKVVCTF